MKHYRLYFLDQANHIRHAISLQCDSDADALAALEGHRDGRILELWEGVRKVARLEPE